MLIIAALLGLFAAKSAITEPNIPREPVAIESQVKQEDKPKVLIVTEPVLINNQ
jgi:hypothetical protein